MGATRSHREKVYRAYMEFFDLAEKNRRWHPLNDVPWDKLDPARNREETAVCLETFCGVELYVPDYTANGFHINRSVFGHAWFQANWGYEESKHALVFREYLTRSGLRTEDQYAAYEEQIFDKVWNLPFETRREMTCYGAIQEIATYLIYAAQREKYEREGNETLHKIFYLVARDEAAHTGFYRKVLQLEMEEDREGSLEDLAHVVYHFQMPGVALIPEYAKRLGIDGVGVSSQHFMRHGLMPTLRAVGTTRAEMVRARRRRMERERAKAGEAPTAPGAVAAA